MRKSSKKTILPYILLVFIIFLLFTITFLLKKQGGNQAVILQPQITPTIILPTSSSDLSYIKIVTDIDTDIKLLDIYDREIGEVTIQEAIADPVSSGNKNEPIKELNVQKPSTGDYKLMIYGKKNSKFSIYFYDVNGDVSIVEGRTIGGASFNVFFDKDNNKKSFIKNLEQK